jgi:hypothetical protein
MEGIKTNNIKFVFDGGKKKNQYNFTKGERL